MTGSEFTDAEKTKMELSFETHALSANTDYSMVVESIVGEGETVHEKTLVLRTNTNGKIEPISVKLYPREDDATKLKGQLEFGTRYYVKRIEEGSTEIHIETAASTFLTPEEPIRIEGADSSLGDSKEKAGVVEFWGVGLSSGKGYTLKVQKESSSGVLSGGVIELVGTLTPSSGSESGRFSHTEEIFGVSAARISYGSSYAIVGIVVGGVEGVVNKKVGFSVPDEPCRLTKMTGSEFTDAEKTKMELSFETHALLRTQTIRWWWIKLYPREDDATKLKGQLEFGTRYYVKRIEEGSTEIHIETAASTFLTPEEPIRIEGADSSLGDSKEKAGVVEFWGVGLSSGKGYTLKVQKESSSGVFESGRFSHTEEIFGVSAARISYGSSYAIVGIVVGGVEGVVNKKVGFSVPDEPCRLTKMTGSEFTDAEKTKMELSFETHALSANTDYSMVVESIVGEGETVHEKTLVLRTNTNGKIEPISVKLIEEGSTEIHIETAASTFLTPEEPIRIEGADSSLGDSKEKAGVVEFWGVGLSSGKGYTLKVQKESSSGVLSGGVIELVGTLTPSSGSESGRFSHTEEIFGVSAARISYGSSYAIVGIVVGGVEGVVNKKVGFSVPDEPCRLTKMTGSEFTDAEKTRIELSFETHALSANTDYSMVVESIVGEGETVHEKTLVLRTNTNGKIEPISVKLYPREDDATKLKGQLEFGTRYYVKRIEEGSTEIHIETAASTFLTPEEPIRIEGADSSLGDSKEKAGVVEFWGVGLSSGKGYTLKVQKESSSGVLSGGVIELVGTLTPSSGSESGRFSHTEEIFGVSAARISYGSSYAIVGIVVGGVEGVVNKKVGFSVPDEPCRLTKMTGSEFTDAEKTKMELSFETHALSANTDYSMVVESIVGEGETVHEKTLVLRTNTNGKIEPISVKLYPREDDATKLKGQLEFGTRYYVKRIEEGSTEIHIETAASTFLTPEEPIRIEGADSSLGDSEGESGSCGVLGRGESGRFSHTEEIFGVSAARISYGSSYAIVGIVVGGVEGVVNKKVGFSVPDEPCRLTKMTGSEFTDAEKTKMELSFETHALSANTDYLMVVESIVGEGETVHEKTLVLRTNTNGKIEPISVKLIEEGSTEIHIETAASTFLTPEEPIRIEGADSSLGDSKEKAGVVEFWGVGLSSGKGYTLKVQKESSSGVLSGGVIELVGTLTPSSGSESGRFSHTEEIFGVSAARISYGSSYAIVGIVVGGVEGVVNKKVGFSVPDEPCRLTKMTGSEFTDAEKTRIELSFETHALSANTDYSMVVESIVGEGETVHEKTLVLRTNTNGKIEPISVKLYPREDDATKLKGQLEFGTRYYVKRIEEGSTEIHIETAASTFLTPEEPIRIEGADSSKTNECSSTQ
ncbi:hypothetical protein BLNAU_21188 [Blattamonas nauphoetae]|uniref:Uncharacterized protein n=1 Tax=Blattamonas nauphoetae TaxID=2049346 RepID=A0ABQ9X0R7_9EUKA|nr:hypothetical protein BLNAU_21188 [Blattamonas nauphoetae]